MDKKKIEHTPSMRQYYGIKEKYPDSILFFRMGDFYEMFGDDAVEAAAILNIALTSRDKGKENPIPMAGVPHHSATAYLKKLIDAGKKVAICEQIGDPKKAKGIVDRKVVRVLTPGTLLEDEFLEEGGRNYLAAIGVHDGVIGLALAELSMGAFLCTWFEDNPRSRELLLDELRRFSVRETLLPDNFGDKWLDGTGIAVEFYHEISGDRNIAADALQKQLGIMDIETHEVSDSPAAMIAAFNILRYLGTSNPASLSSINRLIVYNRDDYLVLDDATLKNLEIIANMRTGGRDHTLMWVLDKTRTPLGRRTLAEWLTRPLSRRSQILKRHEAVGEFKRESLIRESLRDTLKGTCDLSRITARIASNIALPRDIDALRTTIAKLKTIKDYLSRLKSEMVSEIDNQINSHDDLLELLNRAIASDVPQSVEPRVFREGYSKELDEIHNLAKDSRSVLIDIQEREKTRSGIAKLKVAYNKVHGYYIEIPKTQSSNVPDNYFRKQTLVNAERFVTQELKDLEAKILGAQERADELAKELWRELLENIAKSSESLILTADALGKLDVLIAFAQSAAEEGYVQAEILDDSRIVMKESRHPVLEKVMGRDSFVPNDADFDRNGAQLNILTGPNMAGKSTYMRQIALAIIMNQSGSFIPADSASLGIFDRIFTRVGATDDLALGQSTFMVEMTQTAQILSSASPRSFIILDEIGRGTSTFDGLALAWSIAEYIHDSPTLGSITLFATHYHQLTRLSEFLPRVKNLRIMLQEEGHDIIFLRKVVPGRAQKSYGIQVARLAGLPDDVLQRAREIFAAIEKERFEVNIIGRTQGTAPLFDIPEKDSNQTELFE